MSEGESPKRPWVRVNCAGVCPPEGPHLLSYHRYAWSKRHRLLFRDPEAHAAEQRLRRAKIRATRVLTCKTLMCNNEREPKKWYCKSCKAAFRQMQFRTYYLRKKAGLVGRKDTLPQLSDSGAGRKTHGPASGRTLGTATVRQQPSGDNRATF